MTKLTMFSIVGLTLVLSLVLACSTIGLAVRQGALPEVLVRFPPNTRFQFILRIGTDLYPWSSGPVPDMAINLWAHQQGTSWHIINIVHISMGDREEHDS
jgi:hypothetical protein